MTLPDWSEFSFQKGILREASRTDSRLIVWIRRLSEGGVAHWAHIGGFMAGMALAVIILFSRMFNCRGNDMLSVMLGKSAWPLLGKPGRWRRLELTAPPVPGVRAVSMNYPA